VKARRAFTEALIKSNPTMETTNQTGTRVGKTVALGIGELCGGRLKNAWSGCPLLVRAI
jgi:hypothetical protein